MQPAAAGGAAAGDRSHARARLSRQHPVVLSGQTARDFERHRTVVAAAHRRRAPPAVDDRPASGRGAPSSHRTTGTREATPAACAGDHTREPGGSATLRAGFAGIPPDRKTASDRLAIAISEVYV